MTDQPAHTCHARGCDTRTPPRMLMCAKHWRRVPHALKSAVYRTYRPGQETDKNPSPAYLDAARAAIDAVAQSEAK